LKTVKNLIVYSDLYSTPDENQSILLHSAHLKTLQDLSKVPPRKKLNILPLLGNNVFCVLKRFPLHT
tara:strand:+ start:411 stop:611 length:201 start_codon:yes stop_codon:yes gene_type:complete